MSLVNANALHLPFADGVFNCVVTSPPYWGLWAYTDNPPMVWGGDDLCDHQWGNFRRKGKTGGHNSPKQQTKGKANYGEFADTEQSVCRKCGAWLGCYGLEPTLELYVEHTVWIFREVWRVLRADGVLWLNLGDSYASPGKGGDWDENRRQKGTGRALYNQQSNRGRDAFSGLKPKDMCGIPWRVALALQSDGWWLRRDVIWHKPNPMPESVTDRPTTAHEYVFMMTKAEQYWYDAEAVKEPSQSGPSDIRKMVEQLERIGGKHKHLVDPLSKASATTNIGQKRAVGDPSGRNLRSVWTVPTQGYSGAHFATFPEALAERCILAGCPKGGAVLDPFVGSGTVVRSARRLGRKGYGTDISLTYLRENALPRALGRNTEDAIKTLPLFQGEPNV